MGGGRVRLEVRDLRVAFGDRVVAHVPELAIESGESVGIAGESGSGKSMTARAVARLLPAGAVVDGRISFGGRPVLELNPRELRRYRTDGIAMIFQDPRAHTNPVRRIGDFLTEALRTSKGVREDEAKRRAVATLAEVGIEDGARRLRQFPHELSGGMLQRVMIAAALLSEPQLLLADEPTGALDTATGEEIGELLLDLSSSGQTLILVTHNPDLAARYARRVIQLVDGRIASDAVAGAQR